MKPSKQIIIYETMKTTFRKIISEIDMSKPTIPSWQELGEFFNIYDLHWSDDTRLKCYFIKKWYCTDTYVGIRVYFLDEEFICISNQMARKSNEDFRFVSKEAANKLKLYLESLVVEEDSLYIDLLGDDFLDEEIPSTYKIEYNSQILHQTGILNGERVGIIKTQYPFKDRDKYFHCVEIELPDGSRKEIDCRELDFEYNK